MHGISTFLQQARLFWAYADPLAALWSCGQYAAWGLVLALGLMVVCAKYRVFQRRNRYWNIAAKLYFLYIPVVCIGIGAGVGLLEYAKARNEAIVHAVLQPVKQTALEFLQRLPPEINARLSLPAFAAIVRKAIDSSLGPWGAAGHAGNAIGPLPVAARQWVSGLLAEQVAGRLHQQLAETSGLGKERLALLWRQDVTELLRGDALDQAVSQNIQQVLTGHEKTLLLLLLCLLLAPAADTAMAGILEKRGRGDVA